MCSSRFHRVIGEAFGGRLAVEDLTGRRQEVSLLAWSGELPGVGEWVVVHSGYALEPADPADAVLASSYYETLGGDDR